MTELGAAMRQKLTGLPVAGYGSTPSVIASPLGDEATQYGGSFVIRTLRIILVLFLLALLPLTIHAQTIDNQSLSSIQAYLNSLRHMTAQFVQTDTHGRVQTGQVFLSKPGKLRWEYQNPKRISLLIANNKILYFDRDLDQISEYTAENFIFNLLVANKIDLRHLGPEFAVRTVDTNSQSMDLYVTKAGDDRTSETFIMTFSKDPIELVGLVLNDGTRIRITSLIQYQSLDPKLFKL